jgi:hypothetical protein
MTKGKEAVKQIRQMSKRIFGEAGDVSQESSLRAHYKEWKSIEKNLQPVGEEGTTIELLHGSNDFSTNALAKNSPLNSYIANSDIEKKIFGKETQGLFVYGKQDWEGTSHYAMRASHTLGGEESFFYGMIDASKVYRNPFHPRELIVPRHNQRFLRNKKTFSRYSDAFDETDLPGPPSHENIPKIDKKKMLEEFENEKQQKMFSSLFNDLDDDVTSITTLRPSLKSPSAADDMFDMALVSNRPINPIPGFDDAYNTIEGMHPGAPKGSLGSDSIKKLTDFGSGYISENERISKMGGLALSDIAASESWVKSKLSSARKHAPEEIVTLYHGTSQLNAEFLVSGRQFSKEQRSALGRFGDIRKVEYHRDLIEHCARTYASPRAFQSVSQNEQYLFSSEELEKLKTPAVVKTKIPARFIERQNILDEHNVPIEFFDQGEHELIIGDKIDELAPGHSQGIKQFWQEKKELYDQSNFRNTCQQRREKHAQNSGYSWRWYRSRGRARGAEGIGGGK